MTYQQCFPYDYKIYSPWGEPGFKEFYNSISEKTLVKPDRVYILQKLASSCINLNGSFAECGVYKGGTAKALAEVIEEHPAIKDLHLFDTFNGMPDIADNDPAPEKKGYYGDTSLESVMDYLAEYDFVRAHPGIMPSTFKSVEGERFAFVHVDVDLYITTFECCEFFYPRMISGGIILFDDYGFEKYRLAAKKAVDEFFMHKIEEPIVLKTGQAMIIKR